MGAAIGTLLLTVLIGVVIFMLLAFVSGEKAGCCGQAHSQNGEKENPSCCNK